VRSHNKYYFLVQTGREKIVVVNLHLHNLGIGRALASNRPDKDFLLTSLSRPATLVTETMLITTHPTVWRKLRDLFHNIVNDRHTTVRLSNVE
jgi:hypothetical protein